MGGFSDRERLASVRTSKTINKGNVEQEEKREVFLHRLGKDRAGESNAINLLMSSDNKAENVVVNHEIVVNCETAQPSIIHYISESTPEAIQINERECIENVQGREEVLDHELGKEERKKLFKELQIETLDIESIRELDCEIIEGRSSINCAALSTPVIKCDQQTSAEGNIPIDCISKSKNSTL